MLMRKIKFLLSTLVLLLGAVTASAAEYTVDFNTAINTSDHAFQVASNWRHIVGSYIDYWDNTSYPSYSYSTTAGVDGTGALSCSTNQSSNGIYDLLVTPVVKGTVTIAAKQTDSYYTPLLEFYKIIDNGDGTFTRGDKIDVDVSAINNTDYVTITIPVAEAGERIGIRSSYVWLDNFTAEEAIVAPEPKITIASATPSATTGTIYWEQQPNGKVLVSYTVTVTNNGEVDLTQGMDGYSVSIINGSTGDVYSTVAVPQDLAVGETSDEFVVSAEVETSIWPNSYTYIQMNLKENLFGQVVERAQSYYTAYEPKLVFRKAGSTSTSSISSAEAWGTITESTTENYEIFNNGTAPLTINSIQIPEGFSTSTPVVLERASDYDANDAIWAAWTWNTTEDEVWVVEDEGKFTGLKKNVIFVRMNPEADEIPSWSAAWNQTEDLVTNAGMTYVIDSWTGGADGKLGGHWQAITIAKGETKAISITNDATATGTFEGNLVIKHLDKDAVEQTYTLGFSTTVIGLNTWTADFNNTTSTVVYPAGSVAEGGITSDWDNKTGEGKYNIYLKGYNSDSYKTENNKFITPKLHATAGEKLAFDVKAGYSSTDAYFVKVYVSTDRKTWGEPVETYVYSNTGSSFTTKTITFAEEGDYYVAFALYGSSSAIDNLVGLEKVDVAHDLYIKSVSWPDASVKSGTALTKPTVSVIPLTNETAGNYTVKYIYGENEVAIASKDLTASAKNSTDFSASFTPVVASTTTFPGTKVVFDFGGGVTFETETFDLTVTNEPKFHFLNSKYTSRWYEPSSDYTTPYNFGKTNSNDSKTFWILNWGSAPLTVKSITVPEGFTASVASMNLPAFDGTNEGLETCQQSFDITFTATEPGTYGGDMVITYVDGNGDDQTFELAVSGTKLDPAKWYTNFNDQQWPAGSVYQDNVSISYINTGDYGLLSSSSTKNIFITPKLAAAAGDVLQFDASTRNNYYDGTVKVYISNNRENLGDPVKEIELSKSENVSMSTYEYQFAAAGEYYVAFALEEARVDNIYGLSPVAIAHDWMVASSNIPTEAMQNVAKNASVNVLNLGIADEAAKSYEVNLYIGGEKTATVTDTPALAMAHQLSAAGTQITVPMQSPKAGTFPVYIEVKAGDYSVVTDPVNVTFAEEVAKSEADMATNGTTYEVPLYLNYKNSESVTMYNAEALAATGISAGTKIKKITYKGYKTTDEQTTSFQVYYKWTDEQTLTQPETTYPFAAEDNGMTKLIDEDHTWAKVGSSSELGEMIVLDFTDSPLTYEAGKSLVIYMHSYVDGYKTAFFEKSTLSSDYCYTRKADAASLSASFSKATPAAIHFTLAVEPKTYSGTVKDDSGNEIENATVTLVSTDGKNVQYSAITDKNGAYSINVVQSTRKYNATVSAYGYINGTQTNISFDDNVDYDFVLTPEASVSVTVTAAGWATITTPATYAVQFDESTEVYIATGENGESITLEKISDAPAMTPVVINATAGSYTMTKIPNENVTSDVSANILESAKGNEVGDGNGNYYVLGVTSTGVGFGKLASGVTLAKGKAYIPGTALANISDFLPFVIGDEDETTTINAVDAAGMDDDTPVYNLAGQKVGKDYKGVVIVNGRKVVRK